jgi:hypothetical protein
MYRKHRSFLKSSFLFLFSEGTVKGKVGPGKIDSSSAFLGFNLWNNNDNNDFNLEFMDLDEFLSETGISNEDNSNSSEGKSQESARPSTPPSGKSDANFI